MSEDVKPKKKIVFEDFKPKKKRSPEPDLEVAWETIQAMGADGAGGGADRAEAYAHPDSPGGAGGDLTGLKPMLTRTPQAAQGGG